MIWVKRLFAIIIGFLCGYAFSHDSVDALALAVLALFARVLLAEIPRRPRR